MGKPRPQGTMYAKRITHTLQSGLIETQQEVKQFSANVVAINTTVQSSMEEIKQDLTTQLESVFSALCTKLHIPTDNHSSSSPTHTQGDHSSHSHNIQNHHFQQTFSSNTLTSVKITRLLGNLFMFRESEKSLKETPGGSFFV
jgi:hypothetical protein